ncbi:MAG: TIGR02281 family clan AA aspartic protease [Prochloraceae cyanobacterium]
MKKFLSAFFLAIASVTVISTPTNAQDCQARIYDPNGNRINVDSVCQRNQTRYNSYRSRTFRVPIQRRLSGVPLIYVTFNGRQSYPMLLDTGASITTITPAMARDLRVRQEGTIRVNTASSRMVNFATGRIGSVEVGGFGKRNLYVAISNNQLPIGLLGQNFYSEYDITISRDYVEFRPR